MAIEDIIQDDITCIYAAKIIAPHLELTRYEPPLKVGRAKRAIGEVLWGLIISPLYAYALLDDTWFNLTHPATWRENRKRRKELENGPSNEEIVQSTKASCDADKKKLEQELTAAGVVMPQGRQAWKIAHYAGWNLKDNSFDEGRCHRHVTLRAVWTRRDDGYRRLKILDEKGITPTVDLSTVRPIEVYYNREKSVPVFGVDTPIPFQELLSTAIRIGAHSLSGYIINQDFIKKAEDSLLQEIYSRLDKGKEFKLLDVVSVRQEQDRIYLKHLASWDLINRGFIPD